MSLLALHRKPNFYRSLPSKASGKPSKCRGRRWAKSFVPKLWGQNRHCSSSRVTMGSQWIVRMAAPVLLGKLSHLSTRWLDGFAGCESQHSYGRPGVNGHSGNHFLLQWSRIIRISALPSGLDGLNPVQRVKLIFLWISWVLSLVRYVIHFES